MTNTLQRLTISQFAKAIGNLRSIMDKAAAHEGPEATAALLQARLHPTMFTLLQQIQYVCYLAVDLGQHFTSAPPPRVGYDEESWSQLEESLEATVAYLSSISAADVERNTNKSVPTFMDDTVKMNVVDYAARVSLPDFYFHMTIAYAILRHAGVPLGKADFLGKLES